MGTQDGGELWMVLAFIQAFKLDEVTLALEALPHCGGMTVSNCRGFGCGKRGDRASGSTPAQRDAVVDFTPKTRIEIAVAGRAQVDAVIEAIVHTAHTGNPGDGKVFTWPLARVVRVRTCEEGTLAL